MANNCPECGGVLIKTIKDVIVTIPNPGTQAINSDCFECAQCHLEVFDENQSLEIAKKIDFIIKQEKKI